MWILLGFLGLHCVSGMWGRFQQRSRLVDKRMVIFEGGISHSTSDHCGSRILLRVKKAKKKMDSIILLYMHADVANPAIDEKLEECKQLAKAMNDTHGVTNL